MKKFVALMLSLMLLIGCIGSAETMTVSYDLTVMGQPVGSEVVTVGYDEDGCTVAAATANVMGQVATVLAQIAPDLSEVTVAVNDEGYTISAAAVMQALEMVSAALQAQSNVPSISEQDMQIIMAVAMNEVNRFAMTAMQLGVVTISENGDLTIYAEAGDLLNLLVTYLSSLAQDADVFAALASTDIWAAYQLPDAATVQQMVAAYAEEGAQINPDDVQFSKIYLSVAAAGQVGFELAVKDTIAISLGVTRDSFTLSVDKSDYYDTVSVAYTAAPNHMSYSYSDYRSSVAYSYDINGTVIDVAYNTETRYSKSGFTASFDIATLALTGTIDNGSYVIDVTGALDMDEDTIAYVINMTDGKETHSIMAGVQVVDATYSAFIAIDDMVYSVSADIANHVIALFQNEIELCEAGLYMADENTVCAYVAFNGMTYSISLTNTANGCVLSVDAVMGEQTANIATLELTAVANGFTAVVSVMGQVVVDGALTMADGNVVLTVNYGGMSYILTGATTENGVIISLDVAMGEQRMNVATLEVAADSNNVAALLTVNGQEVGYASVTVNGDNAVCTVSYAGQTYVLTITSGENCGSLSLDAVMGEQTANIATLNVAVEMSEESFAHTTAYELSADEIAYILSGLISMVM